jgi:excisionase family DNA binding protein
MVKSVTELPLVLTVQQVQEVLNVSKTTAYELVHTGAIPSVRIGRTFRVTRAAVAEFLGLSDELPTILATQKGDAVEG